MDVRVALDEIGLDDAEWLPAVIVERRPTLHRRYEQEHGQQSAAEPCPPQQKHGTPSRNEQAEPSDTRGKVQRPESMDVPELAARRDSTLKKPVELMTSAAPAAYLSAEQTSTSS
jgi:hypothetical protein